MNCALYIAHFSAPTSGSCFRCRQSPPITRVSTGRAHTQETMMLLTDENYTPTICLGLVNLTYNVIFRGKKELIEKPDEELSIRYKISIADVKWVRRLVPVRFDDSPKSTAAAVDLRREIEALELRTDLLWMKYYGDALSLDD